MIDPTSRLVSLQWFQDLEAKALLRVLDPPNGKCVSATQ
jgi:hypothetical protein